jgi:hypothetical protein
LFLLVLLRLLLLWATLSKGCRWVSKGARSCLAPSFPTISGGSFLEGGGGSPANPSCSLDGLTLIRKGVRSIQKSCKKGGFV